MPVAPRDLKLTDDGIEGTVSIKLAASAVPDSDEPSRSLFRIYADHAEDGGGLSFEGECETTFGEAPVRTIGPDGEIEP